MWLQFSKESKLRLKERCLSFGKLLLRRSDDSVATGEIGQTTELPAATQQAISQAVSEQALMPRIQEVSETHSDDKSSAQTEENPIDFGERYLVLSKLGQGGSAAVYRVKDKELGKDFAIKVMHSELMDDENALRRFKQETEAASCLTHHNLVAVYGNGLAADNAPYLVMDCLDGETLAQVLGRDKQIEASRAINILIQCCEALIHMHMKGILHRDIKPSNIFLIKAENGGDIVKIVDFGIAKFNVGEQNTRLTQLGDVLGSPLYMSPEQCTGNRLDFRSDIYSFGCVMYEMLTGVAPFRAENSIKTILKHVSGTVPTFHEAAPDLRISEALEHIVMKCLQKEPKSRYQNIDELLQDLITFRDTGQADVRLTSRKIYPPIWKRWMASGVDGGILAAIFMLITFGLSLVFHFPYHPAVVGLSLSAKSAGLLLLLWSLAMLWIGPGLTIACTLLIWLYQASVVNPMLYPIICGTPILSCLYYLIFESSKCRATPGKLVFGLSVVDDTGKQLSPGLALKRYFAKALAVPLYGMEHWLEVLSVFGEPVRTALLRIFRRDVSLFSFPPIDRWTRTRVINRKALDNVFLPYLNEMLKEEALGLAQIPASLKLLMRLSIANAIFAAPLGLFVIGAWVSLYFAVRVAFIQSVFSGIASLFVAGFLVWFTVQWIAPSALPSIYYIRLNRLKLKLIAQRKSHQGFNGAYNITTDATSIGGKP